MKKIQNTLILAVDANYDFLSKLHLFFGWLVYCGSYYGQNHPRPKKSDANLRKIIPKWAFGWPSTKKEDKSRAGRPKDQGEWI